VEITEVRIKLMDEPGERLKAFCSITFDNCFVVRDLKIIEGTSGPFVAMPSRKLTAHCPRCGMKNHLRAPFCNQCGSQLSNDRMPLDADGRAKLYADIAHPINSACREMIQEVVVQEYYEEIERAKQPDYVSRYDDFDLDYVETKRPAHSSPGGDTRVDQAHQRRHSHLGNNRPHSGGPVHERNVPSSPAAARNAYREPPTGFGAGIFPAE
jgi:stage V sporulation protein G